MFLLPLLACRCASPEDTGPTDTATVEPPSDSVGVLVAGRLAASRSYDAETVFHGVFSPDPEWLEPMDPLGALNEAGFDVYFRHDWWVPMAEGEEGFAEDVSWWPKDLETWDAGERVLLGDALVTYAVDIEGVAVYVEDDQEALPESVFGAGGTAALTLDGGADLGAQTVDGVVIPEPIELLEGDPTRMDVVGPDEALGASWVPSAHEHAVMMVYAYGNELGLVRAVPDGEGQVVFSPEELVDLGGEGVVLQLTRVIETPLQLDEGVLTVRSLQELNLSFYQVESLGFHPGTGLIGEREVVEVFDVDGRLDEDAVLDLGEGVFTELVQVEDGGEVALFEVVASDDAVSGPRQFTVLTGGEELIANQSFLLYQPLPPNDVCEQAYTGPALLEGELYSSDMEGLHDSSDGPVTCEGESVSYVGRDAWQRMELVEGEVLKTSAVSLDGDVALLIYDGCGGELLHCEDFALDNEIEFLEWTVPRTGTYYLLVDNYYDLESDELFVTWDAAPPPELVVYDHVIQGFSGQLVTVESTALALDGTEAWDFGEGVTVDGSALLGDHSVQLTVSATADAAVGQRTLVADQGGTQMTGPFQLAGQLPVSDDCEDAQAIGALDPAFWYGTLDGATLSGFDTSLDSSGDFYRDVVYQVELPSEGTSLHVNVTGLQDLALYLLRDCEEGAVPVRFSDGTGASDTEFMDYVVGAGEGGTYSLVVAAVSEDLAEDFHMYLQVIP